MKLPISMTQNLGMTKHISDKVMVMDNGEVVERGNTAEVLASPLHEVTRRLVASHLGSTYGSHDKIYLNIKQH